MQKPDDSVKLRKALGPLLNIFLLGLHPYLLHCLEQFTPLRWKKQPRANRGYKVVYLYLFI